MGNCFCLRLYYFISISTDLVGFHMSAFRWCVSSNSVVVVLTITDVNKSVVTGQSPVTLE